MPDSSARCAVSEVELSRAPDASATAVRVDDSGVHALVSIKSGNTLGSTAEHLYISSKWKKAKPIPKLKGVNISAAAWNVELASEGSSGCVSFRDTICCECIVARLMMPELMSLQNVKERTYCLLGLRRPVIVGDDKGQLLEIVLDEKEKRDPPVKLLYSFEDAPARITGLQQHLAQQRTLVLVATVGRLYVFVGGKDLEPLFAAYPVSAGEVFWRLGSQQRSSCARLIRDASHLHSRGPCPYLT